MIIRGGLIVNHNQKMLGDIRVEHGIITAIEEVLIPKQGEDIEDVTGCYVLPGGIDVHTHFDMPAAECKTSDDFYTGTKAAIAGGTTTILDFAEPDLDASLQQGLDTWHHKADGNAFCDYGFHMTVSRWDDTMGEQMQSMINQGVTSFKAYTAYKDSLGVEDEELEQILRTTKQIGGLLCVHCEDGEFLEELQQKLKEKDPGNIYNHPLSRPNIVEQRAIQKVIKMAKQLDAPLYVVHVSTKEGLMEIKHAKELGDTIYAETCPHYLLMDERKYKLPGFESAKYVISPPLRSQQDRLALWKGIRGKYIDTIATDHCSFFYKGQKELGKCDFTRIPNGIPSVEQRLQLMYHFGEKNGVTIEEMVNLTATNPAKIFGIFPKKGIIQVGSDADLVIIKQGAKYEISEDNQYQQVDYTPYEGVIVTKRIQAVFLRGEKIVSNGGFLNKDPMGQYIYRKGRAEGGE
ncbi:dihydropyrimidinase [Lachnospiraceae bacterium LCP25S3_G4]